MLLLLLLVVVVVVVVLLLLAALLLHVVVLFGSHLVVCPGPLCSRYFRVQHRLQCKPDSEQGLSAAALRRACTHICPGCCSSISR
jgi:hypothetical protein